MSISSRQKDAAKKQVSIDKSRPIWWVVPVIALILGWWLHNNNQPKVVPEEENDVTLASRHAYITSHITKTNVHPNLRPVLFLRGDTMSGYGTLVLNKSANTNYNYIVTASHLFSETEPGSDYYDFVELKSTGPTQRNHISSVAVDIMKAGDNQEIIQDVAQCHIGEPKLIQRTSKVRISGVRSFDDKGAVGKTDQKTLTSLATGEKYSLIGQVNAIHGSYWLMLYESMHGESGSGFWGDDSNLYILSGSMPILPDWYEKLGIPHKFKRISLMTGVKITW